MVHPIRAQLKERNLSNLAWLEKAGERTKMYHANNAQCTMQQWEYGTYKEKYSSRARQQDQIVYYKDGARLA
ncbi:MAG: hypothetical protein CSA32_04120 [Desulfobulbus propionicus]|nr:MAG: hypothetical protein CSA32_04120 [Desulfobulbus propionicus]